MPRQIDKYPGHAAFKRFLKKYGCPAPIHVVRMRMLGAIASPHPSLMPVQVIQSFWPDDEQPQLETAEEAQAFFAAFTSLWNWCVKHQTGAARKLTPVKNVRTLADIRRYLITRIEEVDGGFVEGFWGGQEDLDMTSTASGIVDVISDGAVTYAEILRTLEPAKTLSAENIRVIADQAADTDEVVEMAMGELMKLMQTERSVSRAVH